MDELELLKKDWHNQKKGFAQLSYDEIYSMLSKKSSSIVKWIFYISVIEFVFWISLLVIFPNTEARTMTKELGIKGITTVIEVLNYIILAYFIFRFYKNYQTISVTDSAKGLMKNILSTRKTVKQYVWYNLGVFSVYSLILFVAIFMNDPNINEAVTKASSQGKETFFWVAAVIVVLLMIGVVAFLIWLFYQLIYGILLKRLRRNYDEIAKMN